MALFNYFSDEIKRIIEEVSPNYPQLTTYEKEWLYFYKNEYIPGIPVDLEYKTLHVNPTGSVSNAIPYPYKSAILKGQTLVNVLNSETIRFTGVSNLKMEGGNFTYDADWEWGKFAYIINGKPNTSYLIKHSEKSDGTYIIFRHGVNEHHSTITTIEQKNQLITTDSSGQFTISVESEFMGTDFIIQNLMVFEYQDGMENWNIPYFEGMQSVENPVLTTTNEDGTTNILTGNEDVTLRSNGDACDELDLLTGRLTQRIDENNEVLSHEVVKSVDLTPLTKPYEGVNHYHLTTNIPCEAIIEVPVVSTGEQTLQEINN